MLRPTDMAKIGYLYLRDGRWDGNQIVPETWIDTATTTQVRAGTLSDGYGYQWWVSDAGYAMALGYGGQYITVIPDRDLVVVFTSGLPERSFFRPETLIVESILPAIVSDDPLPPDPEAEARLATAVELVGAEPDAQPVAFPGDISAVDGVRFEYRPNDLGWKWFEFEFRGDTAAWRREDEAGRYAWVVGLDGRYIAGDDQPIALRGAWRSISTFVVEYHVIGTIERGTVRFSFSGDEAHVTTGTFTAIADAEA